MAERSCLHAGPLDRSFDAIHVGLYSGNRDMTLLNTVSNVAYAKVVDIFCFDIVRLCHGDDILTQQETYGSALA